MGAHAAPPPSVLRRRPDRPRKPPPPPQDLGPMALGHRHHRHDQPPGRALAQLTSTPVTTDQKGPPPRDRGTRRPARQPQHQPDPGRKPTTSRPPQATRPASRKIEASATVLTPTVLAAGTRWRQGRAR